MISNTRASLKSAFDFSCLPLALQTSAADSMRSCSRGKLASSLFWVPAVAPDGRVSANTQAKSKHAFRGLAAALAKEPSAVRIRRPGLQ